MKNPHAFTFFLLALIPSVETQTAPAPAKPVPHAQVLPLPNSEISFQRDGVELARYYYGTNLNRPFIYPVNGPSGRSLTRMGHPRDPESHSHHNSIWISHQNVGGTNFWEDRGRGRIVHQRIERFDDGEEAASVLTLNAWIADSGKILMRELRQTGVQLLPHSEWLLVIDLRLETPDSEPVTLGKTPFGIIGVRMAKTIGVNDGGGVICNSEGAVGEKAIFWKTAKWVDYSGPITAQETEGITLLDHPKNPNHPSVFHVRSDGWMGASLTFDGPRVVRQGEPLHLRYGMYIHAGTLSTNALKKRWEEFARTPLPELKAKK